MSKRGKHKKSSQNGTLKKLPFPDLRIDCYGKGVYVYLNGMEITPGVLALEFSAGETDTPVLNLKMEPHAVTLKRVKKERIDTTNSVSRYSLHGRKV